MNIYVPIVRGYLKADFVARTERHVPLDVIFGVGQEEALPAVLVADAALRIAPRSFRLQLSGHCAGDPLLAHDLPNNSEKSL